MNSFSLDRINVVSSYGTGDPGKINFIPMMTTVALRIVKVNQTDGGIELPEAAQEQYKTPVGEVLAVGPQVMFLKVGDRVRISAQTMASKVWSNKCDFVLVTEDRIYGVDLDIDSSEYAQTKSQEKLAKDINKVKLEGFDKN